MVNIGYIALCHSFTFPYFVHYNRVGWTGINPDVRIVRFSLYINLMDFSEHSFDCNDALK